MDRIGPFRPEWINKAHLVLEAFCFILDISLFNVTFLHSISILTKALTPDYRSRDFFMVNMFNQNLGQKKAVFIYVLQSHGHGVI